MSSVRLLTRAAVAMVTSAALVSGVGIAETATAVESGRATTIAQKCDTAKVKVKKAKKRLGKAKHAQRDRKAKVRKAERQLRAAKAQRTKVCKQAAQHAQNQSSAQGQATAARSQFRALRDNAVVQTLPARLRTPLEGVLDQVIAQLDAINASIPVADALQLASLLDQVQALDPAEMRSAVEGLAAELEGAAGEPAALTNLLSGMSEGFGNDLALPAGDLGQVTGAFGGLVEQLGGYDGAGSAARLDTVVAALDQLAAQVERSAPKLDEFLGLLEGLNGGSVPTTPEQFSRLIGGLLQAAQGGVLGAEDLPFAVPTDAAGVEQLAAFLTSAGALIGGGYELPEMGSLLSGLGVATDLVTGLLDGVVDGVLGGVLG